MFGSVTFLISFEYFVIHLKYEEVRKMLSPDMDPKELNRLLPLFTKEDLEELLKEIENLIRYEQDIRRLMRLFDNQKIVEGAIDRY